MGEPFFSEQDCMLFGPSFLTMNTLNMNTGQMKSTQFPKLTSTSYNDLPRSSKSYYFCFCRNLFLCVAASTVAIRGELLCGDLATTKDY